MVTYNRKDCIKDAIDSLLTQTYKKFELVIIDDGSTDGTDSYIISLYNEEISKGIIKYIKFDKNKGINAVRNVGLKNVKNEWVVFLDTDNKMLPNFLETFRGSITQNIGYKIFYAKVQSRKSGEVVGHKFDNESLAIMNFIDIGVFVFNREVCKIIGNFDEDLTRLTDWDFILRCVKKYNPLFIDKILLDYYDGNDFERISNKENFDLNYKKVILNYFKNIPESNFMKEYTKFYFEKQQKELENEILNKKLSEKDAEILAKSKDIELMSQEIYALVNSNSWKITKPVRYIKDKIIKIIKQKIKNSNNTAL